MRARVIALALIVSLLAAGLCAAPAAFAEQAQYYSARTPLSGSGWAKLTNIDLAIEAIDSTYIPYGGHFSFNETVGPRTQERGYQSAPNGRGVYVTGGGVAQTATTLYLALLSIRSGIAFDTVSTYGSKFADNYVTSGSQAILVDYNADIDFGFTNYLDDMTIEMWSNDNYVYCSLTVGEAEQSAQIGGSFGFNTPPTAAPTQGFMFFNPTPTPEAERELNGDWFTGPVATEPARVLLATACLDTGEEDDVLYNVELAADCATDTTLYNGDIFSFNDIVGPRTKAYGYRRATNGRGARVTGGGVAQVATVLWLAIKDMDCFSIVEKSTYGGKYNQHYVASSSDAILTDYNSGRDFSFRYTGYGTVTFYLYTQGRWLYCDIYRN